MKRSLDSDVPKPVASDIDDVTKNEDKDKDKETDKPLTLTVLTHENEASTVIVEDHPLGDIKPDESEVAGTKQLPTDSQHGDSMDVVKEASQAIDDEKAGPRGDSKPDDGEAEGNERLQTNAQDGDDVVKETSQAIGDMDTPGGGPLRIAIVDGEQILQQDSNGGKGNNVVDGGDDGAAKSTASASGDGPSIGGANSLFGNSAIYREMQMAQLGAMGSMAGMGGLQENPFLQQQLMMAGGNPFAVQGFPFGAQQALSAHQALSLMPEHQRRFPLASASLQAGGSANSASANSGTEGSQNSAFPEQPAAALGLGFGGRGAFFPDMSGFSGFPTFQQMMYAQQRGGDAEAMTQARRQMMMNGGLPGGVGFRQSLLSTGAGRGMSAELRSLSRPNLQSPAVSLSLACDNEHLSEYQIMVRKQLEVFEAQPEDVESNTQGRKKQVALGQVGIRCKHCASLPLRQRGRGAVYYPAKLQGVYQAAQNMASSHLCESCQCIDDPLKVELKTLRERRDTASGGKQYWADGARALGLYEADDGLRLNRENAQQNKAPSTTQGKSS